MHAPNCPIHLSINEHLACFQLLAAVTGAEWIWVCKCLFEVTFLLILDMSSEVRLLDHIIILFLMFEDHSCYFPQQLHQFSFPPGEYFWISISPNVYIAVESSRIQQFQTSSQYQSGLIQSKRSWVWWPQSIILALRDADAR